MKLPKNKIIRFLVRMPEELKLAVDEKALKEDCSGARIVRKALNEYLKNHK